MLYISTAVCIPQQQVVDEKNKELLLVLLLLLLAVACIGGSETKTIARLQNCMPYLLAGMHGVTLPVAL